MNELYDLLDVDPSDTTEIIKKAYRKKIKKLHPDHGGDPKDFSKIKQAYMILSDPEKRKRYDAGEPISEDQNKIEHNVNLLLTRYFQQYALDNFIISKIERELKDVHRIAHTKIEQLESSIKIYTSQLDNIYRKDNFENIYQSVIHQKINELKFELLDVQYRMQVVTLAMSELKNYYEKPTKNEKPTTKKIKPQKTYPLWDSNVS